MAIGAVLNALWDLRAKREGLPLWHLLAQLPPEELVDMVTSGTSDVLNREEALAILAAAEPGRQERERSLLASGYPAYTTSPGWLGYEDEKMVRLARAAAADGFSLIKLKVNGSLADDIRRMSIARAAVGDEISLAIDANQRWNADEAAAWITSWRRFPRTGSRNRPAPTTFSGTLPCAGPWRRSR